MLEGILGEVAPCAGRPEKAVAPSRVELLLNVHMAVASQPAGAARYQLPDSRLGFRFASLLFLHIVVFFELY